MPKFYKGEWVHFVHFNQFPEKKPRKVKFGGMSDDAPVEPQANREETPALKAHRHRMRLLFKDYDEWSEELKESWEKDIE